MSLLLNSVMLNALTATLMAMVLWTAVATVPAIRRRPGLRHVLWVLVLLKLVTPPLFELSVLPAWSTKPPAALNLQATVPLEHVYQLSSVQPAVLPLQSPPPVRDGSGLNWLVLLAAANACGAVVVLTLAIAQVLRLRRALRRGDANDPRCQAIAQKCYQRMRLLVLPDVCVVSANVTPLLWVRRGRPLVVLPRRLIDQMNDDQLSCVISHEMAHYLRKDHWTNLLSLLVAAICWWNPIVWWARRELRIAQEACCDALVISRSVATRKVYAETLFQALEFIQADRALTPALASGFGGKSQTRRRFEMIANPTVSHRLSWWNYPVLGLVLALLPCLPAWSQPPQEDNFAEAEQQSQFYADASASAPFSLICETTDEGETDRCKYRVQRSERGWVVLAFGKDSKKLLWSAEVDWPRANSADSVHQIHHQDGLITLAIVDDKGGLHIQEFDSESGTVLGQCQLAGKSRSNLNQLAGTRAKYMLGLAATKYVTEDSQLYVCPEWQLGQSVWIKGADGPGAETSLQLFGPSKKGAAELVIEMDSQELSQQAVRMAVDIWQRVHGKETTIEKIEMSHADGKLRLRVKGIVPSKKAPQASDDSEQYNLYYDNLKGFYGGLGEFRSYPLRFESNDGKQYAPSVKYLNLYEDPKALRYVPADRYFELPSPKATYLELENEHSDWSDNLDQEQ